MTLRPSPPTYARDFWSDEVILDPYRHYDEMRAFGLVVWLSHAEVIACGRPHANAHFVIDEEHPLLPDMQCDWLAATR